MMINPHFRADFDINFFNTIESVKNQLNAQAILEGLLPFIFPLLSFSFINSRQLIIAPDACGNCLNPISM
jgi:hypothetical protein